ncbi:MAG TPA: cyclic pyranopterin monophosphate synthase MoaC [Cyclobacteriaceae bacterium]|nr:cyclic pyranopterin monophosphate synthase MoaC [Cyclobacteriaceae bacterium]
MTEDKKFTHLDEGTGNPSMVDVSSKHVTRRVAKAQCIVELGEGLLAALNDNKDIQTKKGPVFQTAIIAGTMAAKKTSDLIPLCHPLGLEDCRITIEQANEKEIAITCTTTITGKTGVEMEALTGATVAALSVYDMCKGFSHEIIIKDIKLMEKTGGKNDFRR